MASGRGPGSARGGQALVGLTLLLLTFEFLLGMWVNLYYSGFPGSIPSVFTNGGATPALLAHVIIGLLLGLLALAVIAWAAVHHRVMVIVLGTVGLLGVLLGAFGGEEFLTHPTSPLYSFSMALGFLVAFGAYLRASTVLQRHRWVTGPMAPSAPIVTPPTP